LPIHPISTLAANFSSALIPPLLRISCASIVKALSTSTRPDLAADAARNAAHFPAHWVGGMNC